MIVAARERERERAYGGQTPLDGENVVRNSEQDSFWCCKSERGNE